MKVKGIAWIGVKTTDVRELAAFFGKVLGLRPVHEGTDFASFRLPDGDQLELFGPNGPDPEPQFEANRVVGGFLVDDLDSARRELVEAGVELVGGMKRNPTTGYAWQHFRGPDGLVYELTFDPTRS
jgi:catechol 2,3-dioxygenase-like lactoylglutathione lyase family enzyme